MRVRDPSSNLITLLSTCHAGIVLQVESATAASKDAANLIAENANLVAANKKLRVQAADAASVPQLQELTVSVTPNPNPNPHPNPKPNLANNST
jgi:hypothetical protein